jgi:uncharacterized membrane protein
MKLKTFLMIVAVVAVLFAIGLILAPGFMDATYGTGATPGEMLTDRMFGSALLALGVIAWLARDLTGASVRPIITGSLIGEAVGFVVALMGTLSGVMNATGWTTVVIYLLFTLGFAYFQFVAPPK